MKGAWNVLLLTLMFCLPAPALTFEPVGCRADKPCNVSMIRIISSPEKFSGKIVRVSGYLTTGKEANYLYFDKDSLRDGIFANALWIDLGENQMRQLKNAGGRLVLVEGKFQAFKVGDGVAGSINAPNVDLFSK